LGGPRRTHSELFFPRCVNLLISLFDFVGNVGDVFHDDDGLDELVMDFDKGEDPGALTVGFADFAEADNGDGPTDKDHWDFW